jgi:hypothetical protein
MVNTIVMLDSVLSPASFAKDCVQIRTISMACKTTLFIFAGMLMDRPSHIFWYLNINREEHSCSILCTADGICEIETAPQSIEATFTGRHETFQYTKVACLFVDIVFRANRLPLSIVLARFVYQLTFSTSTDLLRAKQLLND